MVCCPNCGSASVGYVNKKPLSYRMDTEGEIPRVYQYMLCVCYDCEIFEHESHFVAKATYELVGDEVDFDSMSVVDYVTEECE